MPNFFFFAFNLVITLLIYTQYEQKVQGHSLKFILGGKRGAQTELEVSGGGKIGTKHKSFQEFPEHHRWKIITEQVRDVGQTNSCAAAVQPLGFFVSAHNLQQHGLQHSHRNLLLWQLWVSVATVGDIKINMDWVTSCLAQWFLFWISEHAAGSTWESLEAIIHGC